MKKIISLCIAILTLCMVGCSNSLNSKIPNDLNVSNPKEDSKYIYLSADYPMYDSADEVEKASTNIYVGIVKDISFEIIDMKTAKTVYSANGSPMLNTVYTIEIKESLKGENPTEVNIAVIGGIEGYKEFEQYNKWESIGMIGQYGGIPIVADEKATLGIGEEYLFCVYRSTGDYDLGINLTQFAHHIDSENAKAIIDAVNG